MGLGTKPHIDGCIGSLRPLTSSTRIIAPGLRPYQLPLTRITAFSPVTGHRRATISTSLRMRQRAGSCEQVWLRSRIDWSTSKTGWFFAVTATNSTSSSCPTGQRSLIQAALVARPMTIQAMTPTCRKLARLTHGMRSSTSMSIRYPPTWSQSPMIGRRRLPGLKATAGPTGRTACARAGSSPAREHPDVRPVCCVVGAGRGGLPPVWHACPVDTRLARAICPALAPPGYPYAPSVSRISFQNQCSHWQFWSTEHRSASISYSGQPARLNLCPRRKRLSSHAEGCEPRRCEGARVLHSASYRRLRVGHGSRLT